MVLLSGGHDTLYTTDPKTAADVDSMVALPGNNQQTVGGELRLGTSFAPLARWSSRLSAINGVQVQTANHDTGQKQFVHLKTNISDSMPSVLDVIASRRDGQPLGVAYLNVSARSMHTPAYFGTADAFYFGDVDIFEQAASATPDELMTLAHVLRDKAIAVSRSASGWIEGKQTATYMREVADFFERVAKVPALQAEQRSADYVTQAMSENLERALWLIEHDLACGVVVDIGLMGWDTHIRNDPKQSEMNGNFAGFFDEFLGELDRRRNAHGKLLDQTVTIVGSELGRFPRQNDMLGKDHLPQTSFLIGGPGLVAGKTFGATGRRMEGLPISYRDGRQVAAAGRVPLLDDMGATMLRLAGLDPERYGHRGEICDFLLDRSA